MYCLQANGKFYSFILPPKTGSRSFERILSTWFGAYARRGRHSLSEPELAKSDLVLATVRNPYDVLVSWYHYETRKKKMTFPAYLTGRVFSGTNQYLRMSTLPGAERASRFIRYEAYEESIREALTDIGVWADVEIPHLGAAEGRREWSTYYTPALFAKVNARYAADFERFGYEVHE